MLMPSHIAVLGMLLAQGHGDLLDYVPSDAYWQSKHVTVTAESLKSDLTPRQETVDISKELEQLGSGEFAVREAARKKLEAVGPAALEQLKAARTSADPEVARVAKEFSAKYSGKEKASLVRQLMAIRTLGERKEKSALPALAALEKSPDPFVAEYALRAEGQIQERPAALPANAAQADADVWLFPKDTGILLQEKARASTGLTIARIVENCQETLLAEMHSSRGKLSQDIAGGIVDLAEQVGDVRFDGLTIGVADQVGGDKGWVEFMARGKFDPASIGDLVERSSGIFDAALKPATQGSIKIYEDGKNITILVAGDDRLVIIAGAGPEQVNGVKNAAINALKAGNGDLAKSEVMSKAVKQADRTTEVWGVVGTIPAGLKDDIKGELPVIAAVDSITLTAAIKEGSIHFALEGQGSDNQAIAKGVDGLNALFAQALASLRRVPPPMLESMKPMIGIVESLRATAKDQTATLVGDVKINTLALGLGMLFMELRQEDAILQPEEAAGKNAGVLVAPAPAPPAR